MPTRLWHTRDGAFSVPTDAAMPPGDVEVRCGLRRAFVDLDALGPYAVDAEQARTMARAQVGEVLDELQRRWREADNAARLPPAAGRIVERLLAAMPAERTAARDALPEVLAAGIRRFIEAAGEPDRRAATEQRVKAALDRHLVDNPALAEAREAFRRALAEADPVAAERMSEAAAKIRMTTKRTRRT